MADLESTLRQHQSIGLDTSVFIYHFEGSGEFGEVAASVLNVVANGQCAAVTSVITLMELAVRPMALGRASVPIEYDVLLSRFPNLYIADVTPHIARRAAALRAEHRVFPTDALHLATTTLHGATAFVCNDRRLRRASTPRIIVLGDFVDP